MLHPDVFDYNHGFIRAFAVPVGIVAYSFVGEISPARSELLQFPSDQTALIKPHLIMYRFAIAMLFGRFRLLNVCFIVGIHLSALRGRT